MSELTDAEVNAIVTGDWTPGQVAAFEKAHEGLEENHLTWQCIAHNPTEWALGKYDKDNNALRDIIATVERQKDGGWWWSVYLDHFNPQGKEPSAETAMEAASKAIAEWEQ